MRPTMTSDPVFCDTGFLMVSFRKHRQGLVLLLATVCPAIQSSQSTVIPPGPLPSSESLEYKIEWRLITAGKALLNWKVEGGGFEASLRLESTGLVSKLFKVNDEYTSALDQRLCAHSSFLKTREGSRQRETRVTFDSERKKASYLERDTARNTVLDTRETDIPACVADVIGSLYRMRTLNLEPGQTAQIPVSDGKKSALARVNALQRETVKTPAGTYKTIRYEAFLFNDVIYRRSGRLYIWLTDDRRRLPVQVQVRLQLAIGTITLQLEKEGT
jgi:hypothetical protein